MSSIIDLSGTTLRYRWTALTRFSFVSVAFSFTGALRAPDTPRTSTDARQSRNRMRSSYVRIPIDVGLRPRVNFRQFYASPRRRYQTVRTGDRQGRGQGALDLLFRH